MKMEKKKLVWIKFKPGIWYEGACNSDAVGKGMDLKGKYPICSLQAHREGTGPLQQQDGLGPGAIAHWTPQGLLQGTARHPSEPCLLYSTPGVQLTRRLGRLKEVIPTSPGP